MELVSFLKEVVTSKEGWFCLGYAKILDDEQRTKESWQEEFYSWPDEIPSIINRIRDLGDSFDIYFSPYLFVEPRSLKENAIAGRTIVADLDEANILTLSIAPTILVETSPGRHQGYWILKDELNRDDHEALSRKLTYSIPRCDRSGWALGKKVRIPETYNHKYTIGPQYVHIVQNNSKRYDSSEIENVASVQELYGKGVVINEENLDWIDDALNQDVGPQELLSRIRRSVPTIVARYNLLQNDRSAALWALYMSLFRAGLKKEQIFYIAYHSPNNKFKELRYGGLRELGKDVLRAELAVGLQLPDVKARIRDAKKLSDDPKERSEYIARCVREHLDILGSFIHCNDDSYWYIRNDTGRPISISNRSEHMLNLLDNVFGINASEKDASYVCNNLSALVSDLPITGKIATLSRYDHDLRTFMIHTGKKNVLVVKPDSIREEVNGYNGTVFLWNNAGTVINPQYETLDRSWDDELFDDCLDNIIGIEKAAAKAVFKVWLLSVLLRDGLSSRPVLALFGQPGSGKSTLFRRVYCLMYGKGKGLGAVSKEDDFDYAMAKEPLVVLDNVDTPTRWLADRIAATIAPTEITKRKLFTDMDTVTLRRDAMLGITAHNPSFSREDVTDRLLLFTFERLEQFKPENIIFDRLTRLRNGLWGAILKDIQIILGSDFPTYGYPQFRIEDFAQFGYWIAKALNIADEFSAGVTTIRKGQRRFNLEEDTILVEALDRYIQQEVIEEMPAGQLWLKLRRYSRDDKSFDKRYPNAVAMGRKMWTLIDSLRELYKVSWTVKKSARVWTIERLESEKVTAISS